MILISYHLIYLRLPTYSNLLVGIHIHIHIHISFFLISYLIYLCTYLISSLL